MNFIDRTRRYFASPAGRGIREAVTAWASLTLYALAYLGAVAVWNLDWPTFPAPQVAVGIFGIGVVLGVGEYRNVKRRVPDAVTTFARHSYISCPHCHQNQISLNEAVCADCDDLSDEQSVLARIDRDTRMDTVRAIVTSNLTR